MSIVRWNPVREMAALDRILDQMWNQSFRQYNGGSDENAQPDTRTLALDVYENDNTYTVTASLPGVKAEDVQVNLHDNVLTISGETRFENREGGNGGNSRTLMIERSYGKFVRSIRLPLPVNNEAIEATLENGTLTLTLPKHEAAQPRQIQVKAGNGQAVTTGETTNA